MAKNIEVMEKILSENDRQAAQNRAFFNKHGIFVINLMGSPGSGKTTLLESTIKAHTLNIGVLEGDLETNKDADRIILAGARAHQITTGQTCHLDAKMIFEGLKHLDVGHLDVLFIENVGNLVCPASYDLGAHMNVVALSVPEGSDKIAKYPVMFRAADVIVVTKTALLQHVNFSMQEVETEARKLRSDVSILQLDSLSGAGLDAWLKLLEERIHVS